MSIISFFVISMFKIYCLDNFQVYNTVVLNIITMLYIRYPELSPLITGSLYTLTSIFHFPQTSAFVNQHSVSVSIHLPFFFRFSYKWYHTVLIFLCVTYFIQPNAYKYHPHYHKQQDFLFFSLLNNTPLYIYTTYSLSIHLLTDT